MLFEPSTDGLYGCRGTILTDDLEQQKRYIEIWSKAIDTQMHFNEMSVKSRQLGLTFVAAALGVAVVLLGRGQDFSLTVPICGWNLQLHIAVLLILGAWLALQAVKGLDLNVYHKMLRGAVTFGEDFEEKYMKEIFDLDKGMTQAISHFSRFSDAGVSVDSDGKYQYIGNKKLDASQKIDGFYRRTGLFLLISSFALFVITNLTHAVDNVSKAEASSDQSQTSQPDSISEGEPAQ